LFWKTQDNIDIHIYLHMEARCIEVISYDGGTNTELPRIYINEEALIELIGEDVITGRVDEIQKNALNQRFKETLPPRSVLYDEEKRLVLSSHIISNLQMRQNTDKTDIYSKAVQYGVTDKDYGNVVYMSKPDCVTPVFVARRRHTSEQEISDTMNDISHMQEDIRSMTQRAERMANLVTSSVKSFSGAAQRKRILEKLALPTRRWKWAISLVLLQNRVAITQKVLASYGGKY
jgi:hypothetical protein